jgi:hypothetical protein
MGQKTGWLQTLYLIFHFLFVGFRVSVDGQVFPGLWSASPHIF